MYFKRYAAYIPRFLQHPGICTEKLNALSPSDDAGTLAGKGFFRGRPRGLEGELDVVLVANKVVLRFSDHKCGFSTTDFARFSGSILIMLYTIF